MRKALITVSIIATLAFLAATTAYAVAEAWAAGNNNKRAISLDFIGKLS